MIQLYLSIFEITKSEIPIGEKLGIAKKQTFQLPLYESGHFIVKLKTFELEVNYHRKFTKL